MGVMRHCPQNDFSGLSKCDHASGACQCAHDACWRTHAQAHCNCLVMRQHSSGPVPIGLIRGASSCSLIRDDYRPFFEQAFPKLLGRVFGFDGVCWLSHLSHGGTVNDASALLDLLSPTGARQTVQDVLHPNLNADHAAPSCRRYCQPWISHVHLNCLYDGALLHNLSRHLKSQHRLPEVLKLVVPTQDKTTCPLLCRQTFCSYAHGGC